MTHYLKDKNGEVYSINMGCKHPDMDGNTTASVGCNGNCNRCKYGIASLTIEEALKLIDLAGLTRN